MVSTIWFVYEQQRRFRLINNSVRSSSISAHNTANSPHSVRFSILKYRSNTFGSSKWQYTSGQSNWCLLYPNTTKINVTTPPRMKDIRISKSIANGIYDREIVLCCVFASKGHTFSAKSKPYTAKPKSGAIHMGPIAVPFVTLNVAPISNPKLSATIPVMIPTKVKQAKRHNSSGNPHRL